MRNLKFLIALGLVASELDALRTRIAAFADFTSRIRMDEVL
jgi:hypothetical protein